MNAMAKKMMRNHRSGYHSEAQSSGTGNSIAAQSLSVFSINPKQGTATHAEAYHNASVMTSVTQAEDVISSLGAAVTNTENAAILLKRKYDEMVAHRDMIGQQPLIGRRTHEIEQQLRREKYRLNNELENKKNIIRDQQAELDRLVERAPPIYDKTAEDQLAIFSDELSQWCGGLWDDNLIDKEVFWSDTFRRELLQISTSPNQLLDYFPRTSRHSGLAPAKLLHSVIMNKVFDILIRPPMPGVPGIEENTDSFANVYSWMMKRDENKGKEFRRNVIQSLSKHEQKGLCNTIEQEIIKILTLFHAGSQYVSDLSGSIEELVKNVLNWKTRKFELAVVDKAFIQHQLTKSNNLDLKKYALLKHGIKHGVWVQDAYEVHSVLEPGVIKFGDEEGRYSGQPLVWLPATVLCHEEVEDTLDDSVWDKIGAY